MVGFRNIAVHDDQALQLPITVKIITRQGGVYPLPHHIPA
jgi:hypothetical protein